MDLNWKLDEDCKYLSLEGKDEDIKLATDKLADTDLFFDTSVIRRISNLLDRIRDINARHDSLRTRCNPENSFIQNDLWKIQEEGVKGHF